MSVTNEEADKHGKFKLQEKVTGINLLNYLNKNYQPYIDKLSLIKIDVEGHDIDLIRSIAALIEQQKPALIAECFGEASQAERVALFNLVASHNYELYYFADFEENTEVVKLSVKDMNRWGNFNFYAVPKS